MKSNRPYLRDRHNDGLETAARYRKKAYKQHFSCRLSTVLRPGAALCVDSIPEKNSVVDNIPWRLAALENKFLNFYIMHKSSEVLPAGRLHRLWLADGESFQKPSQLLAGKRPYLRSVPRPLEFSIV